MKHLLFPRDLLRFLYWAFFKPITLDRYIHQIDPTLERYPSLIVLWRRSKEHIEFRSLIGLAFFHILITPWLFAFLESGIFALTGLDVSWLFIAIGAISGMAFGLFGSILNIGVGTAIGVGFGMAIGVTDNIATGFGFRLAGSITIGVGFSTMLIFREKLASDVIFGVVLSVAVGAAFSANENVMFGVSTGIIIFASYFRVVTYIVEAPFSFLLSRRSGGGNIHLSPAIWDELIWLPLPGLDRQLVSIGKANRQEGMKAIAYVASSFRQSWAARRALLELTAYDMQTSNSLESIAKINDSLAWLQPETRAVYKSLLLGIETVSKHAKAAIESDTLYNRQEQLRLALEKTQTMRQGFAYDPNWQVSHLMSPALEVWERLLADEHASAQKQEAIPNVYVAGRPLDTKSKVFRGRRDIFKSLERELISPAEQRPAILLFGARRTGKTSVLRQLPETLGPQVIPVAVDLQDAALEKNAAGLFYKISEKIRDDALQFRHLEFPELSRVALEANPYTAFAEWLKKLQETIGKNWVLINLDEYEYLEKMMNDGRLDDRIFQLLRTLLQNHPHITLLLSGAHTFEDLSPIWSNHLINARVIRINPLSETEARELITKPIPDYPLVYTENAVKTILSTTACQPYLIQAICRDLVNMMNEQHHFHANSKSVAQAIESVLTSASPYFQDLWSGPDTNEVQQTIMGTIARAKSGKLSVTEINAVLLSAGFTEHVAKTRQVALRALEHRDVLKSDKTGWGFQIELVRRWIRRTQLGLKK